VQKRDQHGAVMFTCEVGPGNLVAKKTFASGAVHEFAYDQAGRYLAASTKGAEVAFAYDELGHRVADQRNGKGVTHRFEGPHLVATAVLERFITKYEHDGPKALTLIDPAGGRHRLQKLGHGLVLRIDANRTHELSQYDPDGRCLSKQIWNSGKASMPWRREFRYSPEGHLREALDSGAGKAVFTHDAAHRLTAATLSSGRRLEFEYDNAGNLLRNGTPAARLTMATGNRIEAVASERFEYDHRNSVVARGGGTRYTYNERDQLVAWESGGQRVTFAHDALGRRYQKKSAEGTTEFYHYTDRLQAEVFPDGRLRVYIYADTFSMTPLLFVDYPSVDADPPSGRCYSIFCDQRATPLTVQNAAGEAVWQAEVEPYGRADIRPGAGVVFNLRFPGHYYDPETQLHNNRFREYDPSLGRYLQSDPLGTAGAVNLYAYPADPLTLVDIRGEQCGGTDPDCPDARNRENGTNAEGTAPVREPRTGEQYDNRMADMSEGSRERDQRYGVTILSTEERQAYRVVGDDQGRLVWAQTGLPVDTPNNTAIYVMDQHGNVYVHPDPKFGEIHHSTIGSGGPVASAGEIQVVNGTVTDMNDHSGHYGGNLHPGGPQITRDELASQGVNTSNTSVANHQQ